MTSALLSAPPLAEPAPRGGPSGTDKPATPRTRADERWPRAAAPVGRFSAAMILVLLASAAIHALVVATALMANDTSPSVPPHQEIAVEIVQEPAKEPAKDPVKAPEPAPVAAKTVAAGQEPKAASAQPPIELRKSDPEEAKAPPAAKPAEPDKPVAQAPEPPKPPPTALDDDLKALKSELAALKRERDAIEGAASPAKDTAPSDTPAPVTAAPSGGGARSASLKDLGIDDGGVGPLAGSADALALPGVGAGADEAVGYQAIVFSQLAKAKGIGGRQGVPASAGVRFAVDEAGRLVTAAIVSPSGEASLDAEALAIVRKAAPFPPPPEGAQRVFVANVNFTPMAATGR